MTVCEIVDELEERMEDYMKKVGMLLLIVTLFLSGCGGAKREKEEGNVDYVAKYQSQKEVDPFQVEWRLGDVESAEDHTLY